MTEPAEFIDRTLQAEGSDRRAATDAGRIGGGLTFYGASVGAVRATVRDADRRYAGIDRHRSDRFTASAEHEAGLRIARFFHHEGASSRADSMPLLK